MHGQLSALNEACLDVVGAGNNPQQARIGCRTIIKILDKHSHFEIFGRYFFGLIKEKKKH